MGAAHFACLWSALAVAAAQLAPMPTQAGDFVLRNFRFASGETLDELKLHYMTMGSPRRDAAGVVRNAVLILHGTTGSGQQFTSPRFAGELFGPGQPFDAATHYIILPDGIGHGRSSKPSDGLHARFPRYTYDDMVVAQHRLLTEGLGVNHLLVVLGTSMGGMHTWVWGQRFPDFMDGLVPLASLPTQIAGRNRMMRKMIIDDIRKDPTWMNGDYNEQPRGLAAALQILFMMGSSPLQLQKEAPTRDQADARITEWMLGALARSDANDFLYAFEASRDYDPSGQLERIAAPLLAINSADDLINAPELKIMDRLVGRVKKGRYVLIPTSDETRGHGTHTLAAVWKHHLVAFLEEIETPGRKKAASER